jgi:hypothetical protein
MTQAKLSNNGGSQGVRRDAVSGDVIFSEPHQPWDEYFAWVATIDLPADFLADRNPPVDDFRDPFAAVRRSEPGKA